MKTEIIYNVTDETLARASEILRSGGLVAFPTETVYGLGGNALDPTAASKIYAAKGRPSDNPLIIHIASSDDAEKYCHTNDLYYKIAQAFMPGPITVILPKRDCIPYEVTGGLDTVAVRIPSNNIAHRMLEICDIPIAAPSANISGRPSPTAAKHVIDDMSGRIDMIIDGGDCTYGVESTIIKIDGNESVTMLRPGAITVDDIRALGINISLDPTITEKPSDDFRPLAPGMKYRHYAPKAHVILIDAEKNEAEKFMRAHTEEVGTAFLCYEGMLSDIDDNKLILGYEDDAEEHAHRLFACLREFDEMTGIETIYSVMPKKDGIGLAVYNRLIKAAGFDILKL